MQGEDTIANSANNIVASVDTLSTTMKCISEPIVDEPGSLPVYKLPVEEKMCMSVDRSGRKICKCWVVGLVNLPLNSAKKKS